MRLPQCEIFYPTNLPELLFVTGGRVPNIEWFKYAANDRKIFCVDRGIELCRACEIVPNFLIGDFDSANTAAVEWARTTYKRVKKSPAKAIQRGFLIFGG